MPAVVLLRRAARNPSTSITVEKLVEMSWFKKSLPNIKSTTQLEEDIKMGKKEEEEDKTEVINTFHIISMLEGLDLSPLFENGGRGRKEREASKLEELTAQAAERSRKGGGDRTEIRNFCGEEMRAAIGSIVWTAGSVAV